MHARRPAGTAAAGVARRRVEKCKAARAAALSLSSRARGGGGGAREASGASERASTRDRHRGGPREGRSDDGDSASFQSAAEPARRLVRGRRRVARLRSRVTPRPSRSFASLRFAYAFIIRSRRRSEKPEDVRRRSCAPSSARGREEERQQRRPATGHRDRRPRLRNSAPTLGAPFRWIFVAGLRSTRSPLDRPRAGCRDADADLSRMVSTRTRLFLAADASTPHWPAVPPLAGWRFLAGINFKTERGASRRVASPSAPGTSPGVMILVAIDEIDERPMNYFRSERGEKMRFAGAFRGAVQIAPVVLLSFG